MRGSTVSLERLVARAEPIAAEAAERTRDRILARAQLPAGVQAQAISDGILLSGKRLRLRMMTDPALRNFAR
jgi:hypothetical protein